MTPASAAAMCGLGPIAVQLPPTRVSSSAVGVAVGVDEDWILQRTGIRERRHADPGQGVSSLGAQAAQAAAAAAGVGPSQIDMLICATCTADMVLPSTACWIHHALGWPSMPCFDVSATCAGFMYAVDLAAAQIAAGRRKAVMVVAAEVMSPFLAPDDRQCRPLFGDGAAAVVVQRFGWLELLDSAIAADGRHAGLITFPGGGSRVPAGEESVRRGDHFIRMDGKEVFRQAVEKMAASAERMAAKWQTPLDAVQWFVPLQANARMAQAAAERLGMPRDRLVLEMADVGNTSGASIPIAISRARDRMQPGELVLTATFGAGAVWGCQLFRVDEPSRANK